VIRIRSRLRLISIEGRKSRRFAGGLGRPAALTREQKTMIGTRQILGAVIQSFGSRGPHRSHIGKTSK
jgi:hypothetical protein